MLTLNRLHAIACTERNWGMPGSLILRIDQVVNRKGMARQSQIKQWLAEKPKEEQRPA